MAQKVKTHYKNRTDYQFVKDIASSFNSTNRTNLGLFGRFNESIVSPDWKAATPPQVASNTWKSIVPFPYTIGRCLIIEKITIEVSRDCQVGFTLAKGNSSLSNAFTNYIRWQPNVNGGTVVFDFSENPLRVEYDTVGAFFYSVTGTGTVAGINYAISAEWYSVANDSNYNADYHIGYMGDSFCNVSADLEKEYTNDGTTITGSWTIMTQQYLTGLGIDTFRTNIGQGGSNIGYWREFARNGLFRRWSPDIVFCNVGINEGTANIVSGTSKLYYKELIRLYFLQNPSGCFCMLNVADSDLSDKIALVPSGTHVGKTFLVAIRDVLREVYAEMLVEMPDIDLILADINPANTYSSSVAANYVEQTAGTRLHPNCALGQPKLATVVNAAMATSKFVLKHTNP